MSSFRSRSESARSGKARPNTASRGTGRAKQRESGRARGYQQRRPEHRQEKSRRAGTGDKARDAAFTVLRQVTEEDAYGNLALPAVLRERGISGRDANFATELTYGTLRATGLLDAIIAKAAGRPVEKIDSVALDALRIGAYQLLRTRVESHAAVDTSVELVKANGGGKASGFVNGVLRTISRSTPEQWLDRVAPGSDLASMALRSSHPEWIAAAFNQALGGTAENPAADLAEALEADDARPIVHLAARPGQISAEELALITGGEQGRWSDYAVYLDSGAPGELEAITQGLASVQDEGSQLISLALVQAPLEREDRGRWLDLCAGPGGKTAFIGSWAQAEQATVDATEISAHRADLVAKSTKELPVQVHTGDGRKLAEVRGLQLPEDGFDRVLVDAPCTGLGALRRRPEARWRKQEKDVTELVPLQRELLRSAWETTAPGGVVIYSTCSPHPLETTQLVDSFCREVGAQPIDLGSEVPALAAAAADGGTVGPYIQLWPHRHGTDAMFIAGIRKA